MNRELEATLAHVLRMPEPWQKQAARAMLPIIYKWETRISLPQLSDEDFERQWRAMHEPTLPRRILHIFWRGQKVQDTLSMVPRAVENLAAAVAGALRHSRA